MAVDYDLGGVVDSSDPKDGGKDKNAKPAPHSLNYTDTKDPNVKIGKHGVTITKAQMDYANKNGYAWQNLDSYADWEGEWAHPLPENVPVAPYYDAVGQNTKINGGDVQLLLTRNNPKVLDIVKRYNVPGEVPILAGQDADYLRALIDQERRASGLSTPTPGTPTATNTPAANPQTDGQAAMAVAATTKK